MDATVIIKQFNSTRTGIDTIAYLENAINVGYKLPVNDLYTCSFRLPADDPKASYITPTSLVEIWDNGEYIALYLVDTIQEATDDSGHYLDVSCTHVRKFLQRRGLYSIHERNGQDMADVISWLLAGGDGGTGQSDWVLSDDFDGSLIDVVLDYHFENATIDAALWSLPEKWTTSTQWVYNTQVYPWEINLVAVDDEVSSVIRRGKNLVSLSISQPVEAVANRFYGLGSGEGINQTSLMLAEDLEADPTGNTKNGQFYVEDADSIAKYGLIEDYYTDRSEDEPSLLLMGAKKALQDYKDIKPVITVEAVDLYPQTRSGQDHFVPGKGCRIVDDETGMDAVYRVLEVSKSDVTGQPYSVKLTLGAMPNTLAAAIDRLYNRDNTDKVNAQGATNVWSRSFADNADKDHPITVTFRLPDDLVYVNKLMLDIELEHFRAYETGQAAGGGKTKTQPATSITLGPSVTSSEAYQKISLSSAAKTETSGEQQATYAYKVNEDAKIVSNASWSHIDKAGWYNADVSKNRYRDIEPIVEKDPEWPEAALSTAFVYPSDVASTLLDVIDKSDAKPITVYMYQHRHPHTHNVTIPKHTHEIAAHSHNIDHTHVVPAHSHEIEDHTHQILYGIYEEPTLAVSSIKVQLDGQDITAGSGSSYQINVLDALKQGKFQRIERGKHTLTITPIANDASGAGLCRITGELFIQCFVKSRGDYRV